MDKLQLALLTQWAEDANLGGIQGRKRMQKVVYFLQQAGCPIDAEYTLHHYGPYSRDVANVTDVMVAEGLLEERIDEGGQYGYKLNARTRPMIELTRARRASAIDELDRHRERAVKLLQEDPWTLELGSTIHFSYKRKRDWDAALREACAFKHCDPTAPTSRRALDFAKECAVTTS